MMCASGSNMCKQAETVIKTSCLMNSPCHKKKERKVQLGLRNEN